MDDNDHFESLLAGYGLARCKTTRDACDYAIEQIHLAIDRGDPISVQMWTNMHKAIRKYGWSSARWQRTKEKKPLNRYEL
jgi:hypothetical protein